MNVDKIKIESGMPIPASRKNESAWIIILSKLKVGDSIYIPDSNVSSLAGRMGNARRKLNIKLTMRTNGKGVRVWRIE